MSIQKYIAFLKTIEYGSITEASKALDYSQSGVSRMINDLEEEWNLSLLERGRTGVRLTSDGIRVLPYIKNVCNEYYRLSLIHIFFYFSKIKYSYAKVLIKL